MTPKIRQSLYALGTIATALLALLSVWKVIDPDTASTVSAAVAGVLSLLGAGAAGTAAVVTSKQRHEGMFEQHSPADVVVSAIEAVTAAKANAELEAERVAKAVADFTKDVPVLGPLAQQALDSLPKL